MGVRGVANHVIARGQIRLARRRRRRERVLIVATHWAGSVQQFYHFLLGYLAPSASWVERTGESRLFVRDCGPMNPWFEAMDARVDIQVLPPGVALEVFASRSSRVAVVRGLDNPDRFNGRKLLTARGALLSLLGLDGPVDASGVLVIDRASSEDFYHGPNSETDMSGSERRSVPNLVDAITGLDLTEDVTIVDAARLDPREQVQSVLQVRTLVGQHGAGLAHMLWLQQGSTVIEILPPLPPEAIDTFAKLAKALGHMYIMVPQESVHSPVDPTLLRAAFAQAGLTPHT